MKKESLFIIIPLVLMITSCFISDYKKAEFPKPDYYSSCIIYSTDTSETKYISICNIVDKVYLNYICRQKYIEGYDTVYVLKDSLLHYYTIERQSCTDTYRDIDTLSMQEYREFLIKSQIDYIPINDTAVLYKEHLWDKRILQQMYNKYIK